MPSRVAEILLEQGRQAARTREALGQVWGGALQNIGGEIANFPLRQAALTEASTRQQLAQMQLGQVKRFQEEQQKANDIVASLPRAPDGTWDTDAMTQKLAAAQVSPDFTERFVKTFEGLNDLHASSQKTRQNHAADLADFLLRQQPANQPLTPDIVQLGLAAGKHMGLATDADQQQFAQAMAGGADPTALLKGIRSKGDRYAAEEAKIREKMLEPMKVGPGEKVGVPGTGQVLLEGGTLQKNEAELAADAANPQSPTSAQSKAALDALQAPRVNAEKDLAAWRQTEAGFKQKELGIQAGHLAVARQREARESQAANLTAEGVKPDSQEYRIAQDLAYGKLTFQDFNRIYGRAQKNATLKAAIYDQARTLNPNFNPAAFEMGFNFAKQPKVQQQLASLDNVIRAAPDLIATSNAAGRSGVTALNKITTPIKIGIGNQQFTDFRTAQIAFADELSGALGYGSATDMSREMGFNMTNANLGPQQFASAIQNVVLPFVDRKRATMLNQMGVYGQSGMNPAASAPSGAPPPAGGVTVTAPNGKTYTFPSQADADGFKARTGMK